MKYFIIAGEASGDLHASNLIKSIRKIDTNADFRGFGGDKMIEAGADIKVHYQKMAYMGAVEVLMNLKHIKDNFKICYKEILDYKPDAVILVDYAGFNLRVARFAKEHNLKVLFYISPKVWAWKKSRVKKIKAFIDQLYLILPFEKEYFKKKNYTQTTYVGNPLADAIANFKKEKSMSIEEMRLTHKLNDKPIIALLAGSRKQEINLCLPDMLSIIPDYPDHQFVIAGAPSLPESAYLPYIKHKDVSLVMNQTYQLLNHAKAAIVTSGTATLETALFNVPQVVMYRFNHISYAIFRPFIWLKVKYFSLVNLIMDKEVV
jgi:lipid-A-disaccharide synthase